MLRWIQPKNNLNFSRKIPVGFTKEILSLKEGKLLTCKAVHERLSKKVKEIEENIDQLRYYRTQKRSYTMNAIEIEILGSGCKKCQQLEANAKEAVANLNLTAVVIHITDPIEIAKRGVMSTPAMTINGKVVSKGQVISPEQIQPLLQR
jgi:small redox-active disulfide protein 2